MKEVDTKNESEKEKILIKREIELGKSFYAFGVFLIISASFWLDFKC